MGHEARELPPSVLQTVEQAVHDAEWGGTNIWMCNLALLGQSQNVCAFIGSQAAHKDCFNWDHSVGILGMAACK